MLRHSVAILLVKGDGCWPCGGTNSAESNAVSLSSSCQSACADRECPQRSPSVREYLQRSPSLRENRIVDREHPAVLAKCRANVDGIELNVVSLCGGTEFYRDYHSVLQEILDIHCEVRVRLIFVGACESDKECADVIRTRFPDTPVFKSLESLIHDKAETWHHGIQLVPLCDLIISGIFCGSLSPLNMHNQGVKEKWEATKTGSTWSHALRYAVNSQCMLWLVE